MRRKKLISPQRQVQDSIEVPLKDFIDKQLDKIEDSLEPISNRILAYLKKYQADLEAIETHLATNPIPEWGTNGWIAQSSPRIEDSPLFSKSLNTAGISGTCGDKICLFE